MKLLLLIILLTSSSQSFSACKLWFNSDLQSSYSLNASTRLPVLFSVKSNKKTNCAHFIGVTSGSTSYTKRRLLNQTHPEYLPFQLYQYDFGGILKDAGDATGRNISIPYDSNKKSYYHRIKTVLSIPFKFAPAGRYSDFYTFNVYRGTLDNFESNPLDSMSVEFYYELDRAIAVSVVPSGLPFDFYSTDHNLDFGVLKVGETKRFDIIGLSNAGLKLSAYSINNGVMKGSYGTSKVNYKISFDGGAYRTMVGSLSAPIQFKTFSGVTPIKGVRVKSSVMISGLSGAKAGDYSDTIVITAATAY
ncbi:MAG: hypothetical protein KAG61_04360 [Bacteriovoracaceae bacterium]|nr:hypothetical protein [Bacteriovoracaceae bacterium]